MPAKVTHNIPSQAAVKLIIGNAARSGLDYMGRGVTSWIVNKAEDFKFSGDFQEGVFYAVRGSGLDVELFVGNRSDHADVVEGGRGRNRRPPSTEQIRPWVVEVIAPAPDELESVLFAVARSIGRKGFPGKFVYRDALAENPALVRRTLTLIEYFISKSL